MTDDELETRLRAAFDAVGEAVARDTEPVAFRARADTAAMQSTTRPSARPTTRPSTRPRHATRRPWGLVLASAALVTGIAVIGVSALDDSGTDRPARQQPGQGSSAAVGSSAAGTGSEVPSPASAPATSTTTVTVRSSPDGGLSATTSTAATPSLGSSTNQGG